jgi:hypothetical protein
MTALESLLPRIGDLLSLEVRVEGWLGSMPHCIVTSNQDTVDEESIQALFQLILFPLLDMSPIPMKTTWLYFHFSFSALLESVTSTPSTRPLASQASEQILLKPLHDVLPKSPPWPLSKILVYM